jgi:alkylation response protein AidB-like acyl-CoA dehydrogenase
VDLSFTREQEEFRGRLRAWLEGHRGQIIAAQSAEIGGLADEVRRLIGWQKLLHRGGWVGVHWPVAHGGRGAGIAESFILQEEMARARAPELIGRIGVNLVGPTLIAHGTEEQKRHLPRILAAEEIWCQLFSEPDAGSDLTALRCRAEQSGDHFVINGQKVWASYAQFADWGILLARTDAGTPGSRGIGFFLLDMRSPGVSVRPLRQMTGDEEFNEVFLEDVRVPRSHLVGEPTGGWRIAQTTLGHERGTNPRQMVIHRVLLADLLRLARERGRDGRPGRADPVLRQRLALAWIEVELVRLQNLRALTEVLRHGRPSPANSIAKLQWSEMSQRLHDTAMELLHTHAPLVRGDRRAAGGGRWSRSYLYYRAGTIFAGTSEIQRNIVAQRVLGLPRPERDA